MSIMGSPKESGQPEEGDGRPASEVGQDQDGHALGDGGVVAAGHCVAGPYLRGRGAGVIRIRGGKSVHTDRFTQERSLAHGTGWERRKNIMLIVSYVHTNHVHNATHVFCLSVTLKAFTQWMEGVRACRYVERGQHENEL